jgi:hypothetical protein
MHRIDGALVNGAVGGTADHARLLASERLGVEIIFTPVAPEELRDKADKAKQNTSYLNELRKQ